MQHAQDPRGSRQLLVLAHLYANTDSASLALLRRNLLHKQYSIELAVAGAAAATLATGAQFILRAIPHSCMFTTVGRLCKIDEALPSQGCPALQKPTLPGAMRGIHGEQIGCNLIWMQLEHPKSCFCSAGAVVATRSEAAADAMARPFNALWDQVSTSAPTVSLQFMSTILKSIEHVKFIGRKRECHQRHESMAS